MGATPEISVILPVYNGGRHLAPAVASVLAQSFGDFELLILDDGSTDGSLEVAGRFVATDPRVRVITGTHAGLVAQLNRGIQEARGALIARMDADDESLPGRFARQRDFLRAHPDVVVVGCDYEVIDEDGDLLGRGVHLRDHAEIVAAMLAGGLGVVGHPMSMMRREAVLRAGGYRAEYEWTEDLDLWFRMEPLGRFANLPEILYRYRQHAESVSQTRLAVQDVRIDRLLAMARRERELPPLPAAPHRASRSVAQIHLEWSRSAMSGGSPAAARKHAARALALEVNVVTLWQRLVTLLPAVVVRTVTRIVGGLARRTIGEDRPAYQEWTR